MPVDADPTESIFSFSRGYESIFIMQIGIYQGKSVGNIQHQIDRYYH